jgi:hypothetical protein
VQAQDPASIQAEITALFPQLKLPIFSRHGWLWAKQSPNEHHTCPMWLLCSHVRTTELHLLSTTLCACVKCRGTTRLYIYIDDASYVWEVSSWTYFLNTTSFFKELSR